MVLRPHLAFGNDDRVAGGFSSAATLASAYTKAGGRFDPHSYRWWTIFGTLRWGVGLSFQSVEHLNHTMRSIVMAVSGRRSCELEFDLLRLLAPLSA